MKIPFKQGNEIHLVNIEDIHYLDIYKKVISVHTANETFQTLSTLSDWHNFLSQYGFDMINQSTVANMMKIKDFDREMNVAIFENEGCASVSSANVKKVRNYIEDKMSSTE